MLDLRFAATVALSTAELVLEAARARGVAAFTLASRRPAIHGSIG